MIFVKLSLPFFLIINIYPKKLILKKKLFVNSPKIKLNNFFDYNKCDTLKSKNMYFNISLKNSSIKYIKPSNIYSFIKKHDCDIEGDLKLILKTKKLNKFLIKKKLKNILYKNKIIDIKLIDDKLIWDMEYDFHLPYLNKEISVSSSSRKIITVSFNLKKFSKSHFGNIYIYAIMTNKISDNNLIKKGDRILLEIEKGHILISQRVRALESGDKGDIIKVKNKNKKIDAEIIGKSKVKLLDD